MSLKKLGNGGLEITKFPNYKTAKSLGWCCHLTRQQARLTIRTISLSINDLRHALPRGDGRRRVIKLDIINEVVNRTGITKTKAELAVETVFESMKKALATGDRIELRGFGVFNVRPRKTGIGRNPRTGAEVSIPPGKAVRFKPGKELQSID
jgi:DNA-binding protein HU-beta